MADEDVKGASANAEEPNEDEQAEAAAEKAPETPAEEPVAEATEEAVDETSGEEPAGEVEEAPAAEESESVAEAEALVVEALALEDEGRVGELLRSKLEDRFPIELEGFIPSDRAN